MSVLPKQYDHKIREAHWQNHWVAAGTYHFRDDQPRDRTFVIDTPPPTVSGVLHMGHIFSYTQADFIARYQRMKGKDVFYPMGFDDNGLPTERLVEKIKNVRGSAMPRADFVALCREVVAGAEDEFRALFRSAALSVDWRQEYQTISDDVRRLSQASFLDLLRDGQAYRDFRPTYWDWVDQTAIAQAEIEDKELAGSEVVISFALMDKAAWEAGDRPDFASLETRKVMTTRPELLGACVALMCHSDEADTYRDKIALTPLFNVAVPIIGDDKVSKEKGTGMVMCCTFGDDTDKEWWRHHKLPLRALLGKNGKLDFEQTLYGVSFTVPFIGGLPRGPIAYAGFTHTEITRQLQGLKPKQAKEKTIELLKEAGLLLEGPKPISHAVKCAERSGTPIEIIPTSQWFVRIVDKKSELLETARQTQWHPEYMRLRLNQWIEGLKEDWCISRQRFFGVPFPVWYSRRPGEEGKILVPTLDRLPIDPTVDLPEGYAREEVIADIDVMDTWATSSISPQLNARGIHEDFTPGGRERFSKLFPADLRPQAHEIIRSWAFYTIAKAYLHTSGVPWRQVMISGWCLAADKTKMSKSKGNVVTPVALIEEKGSDAVRYWASTSRLGTDTAFSEDLLKIGRKLVTKLWNASQFAAQHFEKLSGAPTTAAGDAGVITETLDRWILSRLNRAVAKAGEEFERFEYCDARVAIEDFFWNDFCDNYLELVKGRAYGEIGDAAGQQSALYTLHHVLDAVLRLFAPFVPHVCEDLYSHLYPQRYADSGSVHARGMWPEAADYPYDAKAEMAGMAGADILGAVRKAKSEAGVSIKFPVERVAVHSLGEQSFASITPLLPDLMSATGAADIVASATEEARRSERGWFSLEVTLAAGETQKSA